MFPTSDPLTCPPDKDREYCKGEVRVGAFCAKGGAASSVDRLEHVSFLLAAFGDEPNHRQKGLWDPGNS